MSWPYILGILGIAVILYLIGSLRVLRQYERGVVFLLGKFEGVRGPGLTLIFVPVQQMVRAPILLLAPMAVVIADPGIPRRARLLERGKLPAATLIYLDVDATVLAQDTAEQMRAVVFEAGDEFLGFAVKFGAMRTVTMQIPSQKIITKDNVSIDIAAVAYYHISDPERAVIVTDRDSVPRDQKYSRLVGGRSGMSAHRPLL